MEPAGLGTALPRAFYDRPTATVARALLGCSLARVGPEGILMGRIVETEAYGSNDPASHAFRGPTKRNRSMFGDPGTLYVYRIHQVHCANAVTRRGQAVLLRALEPVSPELPDASGPGRLCRALGLTIRDDGSDLIEGRVRIYPRGGSPGPIVRSPRIGIRRAVDRPMRFSLAGNPFVSSPRPRARGRSTA
ncbi:MAG: DNA-3-methyladenine glycosylase [Thermoplasmata archaeon]|nr:DNA-3-methyladenine glycosylase [Thermoplasmata archaeon]